MVELDRRTVVKGAAWSLPVIAMAVATPLAAASEAPAGLRKLLRLTNVSANPGQKPNTVYVNTMVLADTGEAVQQVVVRISINRDGVTKEVVVPYIGGWGNSGQITHEFTNVPKGGEIIVTVEAFGINAELVRGTDNVGPGEQTWWPL